MLLVIVDALAYTHGRGMPRCFCLSYQPGTSDGAAAPCSTSSESALLLANSAMLRWCALGKVRTI